MVDKRGLFVVFEGVDGCGKSTQLSKLFEYICSLNKYIDIIKTHEPWKSKEIKRKLKEDKDAYSDALGMAKLYIEDRINHAGEMNSRLENGYFVLCDRYKMSTCAYQWTQGIDLFRLFKMHESSEIIKPEVTYFIDVSAEVAQERRLKRGDKDKFEDWRFQNDLIAHYHNLINRNDSYHLFGKIVEINGRGSIDEVFRRVREAFNPFYNEWLDKENKQNA